MQTLDSLFNIGYDLFFGAALAYTTGQAWTLCDPVTVFTVGYDDLSHIVILKKPVGSCTLF